MDNEIMDDIGSDYALCALLKSWRSWFLTRNEILAIQQGQSAMRYRRGTRKTSAAQ